MLKKFCALLLLVLLAARGTCAWDIRDEGYTCGTVGMTLAELQSAGITLVSHIPCKKEWMEEAAKYGIRGMPYISLYKVYDVNAPGAAPKHPFWGAVDMTHHPEWVYVGPDGKWKRPFNNPFYPKVYWQSCTNTAGIADAYCRGAAGVIKIGAGGVFIDNVLPAKICYGPKFGVHEHIYPDKDNIYSFKIALKRVQDTVKSFGEDKVVMLNVGRWDLWKEFGDCLMLESFIYNVAVRPGPGGWVGKDIVRVKQWPQILKWINETASYVDHGGCIVTLEYLPNNPEAAVYTYACAKLGNFLWSGSMRVRKDVIRTLHRCRLQKASGPLQEKNGVYFRHYPGGMAVVNSTDKEVSVMLPGPNGVAALADVLTGKIALVRDGRVVLRIPAEAGRVYVTPRQFADGLLREVIVALETAAGAGSRDAHLQAAIQAAQQARRTVKDDWAKGAARSLADLCQRLAACESSVQGGILSARLAAGPKLSREDVSRMVRSADDRLSCKIAQDKVVIQTGGVQWELGTERALVRSGDLGANCGVTIGPLHKTHGWLKPAGIENARLTTDTDERKVVEITMPICGTKTRQTIAGVKFLLTAEARRGENCLRLKSAVLNTGKKDLALYMTWSSWNAGTWCSYPGQPSTRSDRYVNFGKSEWTYVHRGQAGGKGVLIIADLPQSYSPYAWNIYSEPRSGPLAPGEKRTIAFDLYVVQAAWHEDPAAAGAFRRGQVYASLAYFTAAGPDGRAQIEAEKEIVSGRPFKAFARTESADKPQVEGAWLLDEKGAVVVESKPRINGNAILIATPPSLRKDRYYQLVVRYMARGAAGNPLPSAAFTDIQPTPSLTLRRKGPATWDGRIGKAVLTIQNHLGEETTCRLSVEAPERYDAPSAATIKLGRGEARDVPITVSAPKTSPPPSDVRAVLRLHPQGRTGEQELSLHFVLILTCPRLPSAPRIDGRLDDEAWKKAAVTTPFVLIRGGGKPKESTVALVGRDGNYLYVAFRCKESQMKSLVAKAPRNPGVSNKAVHRDDSVEVFLSPSCDKDYVQLAANSIGAQKMSKPVKWDVAGARNDDGWTVEMRIEFASLGGAPKAGDGWTVNFCRMEQRLKEASSWSPTDPGFHQPDQFGLLVFGD